jgi:CYTH domain-containing protein
VRKEAERRFVLREDGVPYITRVGKEFFGSDTEGIERLVEKLGEELVQEYMSARIGQMLAWNLAIPLDFTPAEARFRKDNNGYTFTLKGPGGLERDELETLITEEIYKANKAFITSKLKKRQLSFKRAELLYVVDRHQERDLLLLEVEAQTPKARSLLKDLPAYGREVTLDEKYNSRNLARPLN